MAEIRQAPKTVMHDRSGAEARRLIAARASYDAEVAELLELEARALELGHRLVAA